MNTAIVVGVDGSAPSLRAAVWAADEAALRHAPLRVVNAFGIPDAFYGEMSPPRDWLDPHQRASESIVRAAVATAERRHPRLATEQESVFDGAVPVLLRRSRQARMIVVGSAGRGVLGDLVVGSAALALTVRAACPVAVIRGEEREGAEAPVVAGVDGGPVSQPVLACAFEEAAVHGLPLVAVHAGEDVDPARVLAEALAGWAEKFPDVEVRRVTERDKPRQRLLDWSTRARMVVVGSRGRGGFAGLLLGSTSQALIQHAECPVLVTRGK